MNSLGGAVEDDVLHRVGADNALLDALLSELGVICAYLTAYDPSYDAAQARGYFAADGLIIEDPATGSAAVGFAGVVHRFDALPDGPHKRTIEQGFEMGRPSLIELSLHIEAGKLDAVRIGGHAVLVAEGTIEV